MSVRHLATLIGLMLAEVLPECRRFPLRRATGFATFHGRVGWHGHLSSAL